MTAEMHEVLDREVADAVESGDNARIMRCMARYMTAMGDCQYKTADRVKSVKASVEHIREELIPLKASQRLYFEERMMRKGAAWAVRLMWGALAAAAAVAGWWLGNGGAR